MDFHAKQSFGRVHLENSLFIKALYKLSFLSYNSNTLDAILDHTQRNLLQIHWNGLVHPITRIKEKTLKKKKKKDDLKI